MAYTEKKDKGYYLATLAGICSILLWASTIAFSKSAMDKEGNFNLAFYNFFYGGITLVIILSIFQRNGSFFKKLKTLPFSYYLKTGIFLILNNVFLYTAIGLARKNEELIIVTLLNYCWPFMIYVVRIFVFKVKIPIAAFIAGILLSITGIAMALIEGNSSAGIGQLLKAGRDNMLAYSFAFLTAISWALYSNLTVLYKTRDDIAALPVLFLISGLVFLIMQGLKGELSRIHLSAVAFNPELLYIIVGPTSLAYLFWYFAIKRGNKILITALSFFIPLLSMLILHAKLHLQISLYFWMAVTLLIAGSYICYRSFQKSTGPNNTTEVSHVYSKPLIGLIFA